VIGGIVGLFLLLAALRWAIVIVQRRKRNRQYPELSQYSDAKLKGVSPGPPPTELPGDGTYFDTQSEKGPTRVELPAQPKGGPAV
jgi:hypothetical protein